MSLSWLIIDLFLAQFLLRSKLLFYVDHILNLFDEKSVCFSCPRRQKQWWFTLYRKISWTTLQIMWENYSPALFRAKFAIWSNYIFRYKCKIRSSRLCLKWKSEYVQMEMSQPSWDVVPIYFLFTNRSLIWNNSVMSLSLVISGIFQNVFWYFSDNIGVCRLVVFSTTKREPRLAFGVMVIAFDFRQLLRHWENRHTSRFIYSLYGHIY